MKVLESAPIALDRINLPPNWRDGLDEKNVAMLVEVINAGKPLPPIRLNAQTEVTQGWHRIAAHIDACRLAIPAVIVEYESAEEQEADALEENLYRRKYAPADERAHWARLVKLRTAIKEQAAARKVLADAEERNFGPGDPKVRGRSESPRRAAMREIAAAGGPSERTLKRASSEGKEKTPRRTPPGPADRIRGLLGELTELDGQFSAVRDNIRLFAPKECLRALNDAHIAHREALRHLNAAIRVCEGGSIKQLDIRVTDPDGNETPVGPEAA